MVSREDVGSWLEGTPTGGESGRGGRLGLPSDGPGSLATVGRRAVALVVDWVLCLLISYLVFDANSMATLGVFAVENLLLVSTLGYTVGHRVMGLQVRVLGGEGRMVGLWRALVRTVLLCLVVPAVVWDGDGRGMHDKAAGTVIVRA
ncbi:RDD family protein [Oerskovia turbata]|uniref:RDD family protein n=1 Tax=Oerskovia turbata TaxID=1713 RepID=A0A4Q1KNZ9_9CELL|nr:MULTISPECIES: RDD family protein [Oerskovia]QDW63634.1 RDD family protein [Oerskovia sp. KBS0722]RXR23103.1 RDD family protein [Oerskovia turbata]RXR31698.1 RDD family protein [Oerskovia turbata]TGJ97234.1 RDD family protein [Actinotalea fermentans ATCC 43279 = JCM 9966 = DSM 3133]